MSQAASTPVIQWNTWQADAFARASREGRPILLSLTTTWSAGCREMDRSTYADPGIVTEINERFLPIRVDADERPDIADRYELGGLPTIAFLSPAGHLLGGGTFVDAAKLRDVLRLVPPALARSVASPDPSSPSSASDEDASRSSADSQIEAAVLATADHRYGGFGGAPKFPHAAAVRLALQAYAEGGDPQMLETATRTLDAMGWGELFDTESGGFFRCCGAVNWTDPQRELLAGVNASLLELYLEAAATTTRERYLARASDIVRFIDTGLRRQDGAWRLSANVSASRVFSDANARAASALLHAARIFDDSALGTRAIDGLEQALLASYKPGDGVAHYAGGHRGLLTDHVAMIHATLDAWEETGNVVYRMMAEELTHFIVRTLWDERGAGFFDRAPSRDGDEPPGATGRLKPFVLNCQAALALRRLAEATHDPSLQSRALAGLAAMAPLAHTQGPDAAHYLLARRAVLR